eukprot:7233702-Pyramimonas_sp.AAC.1
MPANASASCSRAVVGKDRINLGAHSQPRCAKRKTSTRARRPAPGETPDPDRTIERELPVQQKRHR